MFPRLPACLCSHAFFKNSLTSPLEGAREREGRTRFWIPALRLWKVASSGAEGAGAACTPDLRSPDGWEAAAGAGH